MHIQSLYTEQRKVLHKTIPKNTTKANRQIFDVINAMEDTPDKYTSLFNACEEGGMIMIFILEPEINRIYV